MTPKATVSTPNYRRRAALISTAIALPVTVIVAFAFTAGRGPETNSKTASANAANLSAVSIPAPPEPDTATQQACTTVFAALPVQLDELAPRKTNTNSSFVAAWGDPAVVLRCGVSRPAELAPQSAEFIVGVNTVQWLPRQTSEVTVWTSTDRVVFIELSLPKQYSPQQLLPDISNAVKGLPAVCENQNPAGTIPEAQLCTRRK
jgi:hypothetical protein